MEEVQSCLYLDYNRAVMSLSLLMNSDLDKYTQLDKLGNLVNQLMAISLVGKSRVAQIR